MYRYVRLYAIFLVGFHILSPYFEIEHVWGAGGFPTLSLALRLVLSIAILPLLSPAISAKMWQSMLKIITRWRGALPRFWLFATTALVSSLIFWLGRLRHLRWGDAYIFANAISHPDVRLTYSWQSPFDVFLHAKAWEALNRMLAWDVQTTYALISVLAGAIYVLLLLSISRGWGQDHSERSTVVALMLTLGSMELFFGYVESYTIIPVGIVLFLALGMRFLRCGRGLWLASLALAMTHGFSPSTLPLSLSLVFLGWWAWRKGGRSLERVALEIIVPMLLVAASVLCLMTAGNHGIEALLSHDAPGGGDARLFVPLFEVSTKWEHYTMLSWAHLRDFLNEQLLVAPFSLFLLLVAVFRYRKKIEFHEPRLIFLAIAAATYLFLTFVWNPDYGGRRDWDLFAPASFPLTLLSVYIINRYVSRDERESISALVVGVSLLHLLPWVYFNAQPWPWD